MLHKCHTNQVTSATPDTLLNLFIIIINGVCVCVRACISVCVYMNVGAHKSYRS